MANERAKQNLDYDLRQALKSIKNYLIDCGPDKEMELLYDYMYKKVWKIKT